MCAGTLDLYVCEREKGSEGKRGRENITVSYACTAAACVTVRERERHCIMFSLSTEKALL